ncbi:MAG: TMEM14 family protein [Candidatus Binatia bacterium]
MGDRKGSVGLLVAGILVGAGLVAGLAMADGGPKIGTTLIATSAAPRARGWASFILRGSSTGKFMVMAKRLAPNAVFDVVVGDVKVAQLTTNGRGNAKVRLRTSPRSHDLLLGFDPRGDDVVVRDDQGRDCLVGSIPGETDSASGACCLTRSHGAESHTECEDLTAAACTAAGGAPSTATSCVPDPCTPPPTGDVVCCVAGSAAGAHLDDHCRVSCQDITVAECAAARGKVVPATSCDPNPCRPVPPAGQVGCCLTEDDGDVECEHVTPERCAALGGSAAGAFCAPALCGGGDHDGGDHDGGDHDGGDHHHHHHGGSGRR